MNPEIPPLHVRHLPGPCDYLATWQAMQEFTARRDAATVDELWICEHPPVYTLGQAGKPEHRLVENDIPLIRTDRGGQITYHGPGQLILYLLLDLSRRGIYIRELVFRIEQAVIDLLTEHGIPARRLSGAPGVYVGPDNAIAKIAALGLRVRRHASYHGLSLNVDMDLSPFSAINACGYAGMAVTQMRDFGVLLSCEEVARQLVSHLTHQLEKA